MGEVYRARDERLGRDVAIKVLPAEFAADRERLKRFEREARATAALSHPNILAVHDVGTHEGVPYLVEELLEGESLKERLDRGSLPQTEALRIAGDVANGLAAAHEQGIVHRDLKPGNVFLTRHGTVKVLDFGLAKLMPTVAPDEAETLTRAPTATTRLGGVLGTLAYMAPEQARGQPVDQRADVFALGVVFYEMLSGERPFRGATGTDVVAAILKDEPAPLPAGVPPGVATVVTRCLSKDPDRRYQCGSEVRAALDAVQSGVAVPAPSWFAVRSQRRRLMVAAMVVAAVVAAAVFDPGGVRSRLLGGKDGPGRPIKLAVLPFANLTGDPEQEYLSDGLTQEMITQLGRLHPARMSVIGRSSVTRYKKIGSPIDQIGRDLRVGYILEGTCRKEGARVRISVELIQIRDQAQLWAETYERDMAGLLALQSDIARQVAGALALKLLPSEEARLAKVRTVDPEAYEAYLKGTQHRDTLTKAGFDASERYFNLALEKDPSYAAAWAGIASVWNSRLQLNMATREEALLKAKSAALKALALDDGEIEARRILAGILTWMDWDWEAAERAWGRLFEIDPGNAAALPGYSHYLMVMGRPKESMENIERALALDPYNIRTQSFHAVVLMHVRRFDDAIAAARKVLSVQPGSEVARSALIDSLFMKGMYEDLLALERERWAKDPEMTEALEQGYAEAGFAGAGRRQCEVLAARYGKPGGVTAYTLANACARAGDKDRVIEWLEKAYEEHNNNLPYMRTPVFDPVRTDPRFQALLRRVNLPVK